MSRSFTIKASGFPDFPQMMLATLNALRSIGGSASLHELDEQVVDLEGVTEEEQAFMMPDGKYRKLNYYLSWARTYLGTGNTASGSAASR